MGQLPTPILVDIVDNDAYIGAIQKSPFNFKHNSISFITIYGKGVEILSKPLQSDFTNDHFIRSNMRLLTQTGQYYRDTDNATSQEQFKNGCALFGFDLTPQLDSAEVAFKLIKHGNIRIEIHFANAVIQILTAAVLLKTITYWKSITSGKLHSITTRE